MGLHGFRVSPRRRGGRSHACEWGRSRHKAHRAASLAYVFRAVHRRRVFFSGALEPPAEVALGSGARAAPIPGFV